MRNPVVTRNDIAIILRAWQAGEMSAKDVHAWADDHYFPGSTEFIDWEDDQSVSNEVMALLDMLDVGHPFPEQIPIHLEFLETPSGKFAEGYERWKESRRISTTKGY